MPKYRTVSDKTEIFAKESSLAIEVREDTDTGFSFYVYNRRTGSILHRYEVTLMDHCKDSYQDVAPIPKLKKRKLHKDGKCGSCGSLYKCNCKVGKI